MFYVHNTNVHYIHLHAYMIHAMYIDVDIHIYTHTYTRIKYVFTYTWMNIYIYIYEHPYQKFKKYIYNIYKRNAWTQIVAQSMLRQENRVAHLQLRYNLPTK